MEAVQKTIAESLKGTIKKVYSNPPEKCQGNLKTILKCGNIDIILRKH